MSLLDDLLGSSSPASPVAGATPDAPNPLMAFLRPADGSFGGADALGAIGAGLLTGDRFHVIGPGFQTALAQAGKDADARRQRNALKLILKQANPNASDAELDAMASDPTTAKLALQAAELQASSRAGAQASGILSGILGGGASPGAAATPPAPGGPAAGASLNGGPGLTGDIGQWARAIQANESSGNYGALGPTTRTGDRAYGAYQVMGANIPQWTREALGREMTPQEFLADKGAQDAVFAHRFGSYVEKYGNPQDAASAWFTGKPLAEGANRKDVLGTSGTSYVAGFNRALGQGGAPTRVADASGAVPIETDPLTGFVPSPGGGADNPDPAGPQPPFGVSPSRAPVPGSPQAQRAAGASPAASTPGIPAYGSTSSSPPPPTRPLRPGAVRPEVAENEEDVQRLEQQMGMVPTQAPTNPPRAAPSRPSQVAQADLPAEGSREAGFYVPSPDGVGGRTYTGSTAEALRKRAEAGLPVASTPSFSLNSPAEAQRAIPKLMGVLNTPHLPDAQKAQAKTLLDYALNVVKPTDRTRQLMEAGYTPGTPEYVQAYRNLVNGDRTPMGYRLAQDGQSLEPIPGGPSDPANKSATKAPTGFRVKDGDGQTFEFVPGGPADPATIAAQAQARAAGKPAPAPKPLPHNAVKDLAAAGEGYGDFNRIVGGFQDGYAGWRSAFVGDTANQIARNTGIGNKDAADWWADYSAKRNVTRNKLFGSALTSQEKSEFEKADITPAMQPDLIRKNLARQQDAATSAARKLGNYYVKAGRNPAEVEAALGVPLDALGITVDGAAPAPDRSSRQPSSAPRSGGTVTPAAPPPAAIDMLRRDRSLRDQFDAKYGAGASDQVLGGGR